MIVCVCVCVTLQYFLLLFFCLHLDFLSFSPRASTHDCTAKTPSYVTFPLLTSFKNKWATECEEADKDKNKQAENWTLAFSSWDRISNINSIFTSRWCEPIYTAFSFCVQACVCVCVSTNPWTWHMVLDGGCQVPHNVPAQAERTRCLVFPHTHTFSGIWLQHAMIII